jgi:hypothetical protein
MRRPGQRRLGHERLVELAAVAVLALLTPSLSAFGQQRAAAPSAGPSFQSGGLKATVTSISAQRDSVSISLLIENRTSENLLVAVIGPPIGTNGGNVYSPVAVGGIAYCIYNPKNINRSQLDRSSQINGCLRGDKPELLLDSFTLIDAGSTVPMNVGFTNGWQVDQEKAFSFAMNVAVFKESDANFDPDADTALGGKPKGQKLPKSLRYISVGIPSLPFSQK